MKDIIIMGNTPSKKNSNKINCSRGFPQTYKTAKFKEWHKDALKQLKEQKVPQNKLKRVDSITMTFWKPDRRKADSTNKAQSIEDLLVDYGFIEDDNCDVLPCIQLIYGGISKARPRCEIEII